MQFKHPELLYALLLLAIPIIVHLFQLRRFQKVEFTNVQFLKDITIQTRKSSQLKKWLTLLTRLLLLACIIIAFAQPYLSNSDSFNTKSETVIYLDNSFSMEAKSSNGTLLNQAIQDILQYVDEDQEISLFTNNRTFNKTTIKAIKNDLIQLKHSPTQLDYEAVVLKGKNHFSDDEGSVKNLVLISDFQTKNTPLKIEADSIYNYSLVQLKPERSENLLIDSLYISKVDVENLELTVVVNNQISTLETFPVSLFDKDKLIAKTSVSNVEKSNATFTIPANVAFDGRILIEDASLQYDNVLYFNINSSEKIKVLAINSADDSFLRKIYSEDEFEYSSTQFKDLNYNAVEGQNLIVLNELQVIPMSLSTALKSFTDDGGYILIIPSKETSINTYNQLFVNYSIPNLSAKNESEKRITTINFSHPLLANVFDKKVSNFQYPKVQSHYPFSANGSRILGYEDGASFLLQSQNAYAFSAPLNEENSNFKNSPLIVPVLYNIGKQSLKFPKLYYNIGSENTIDVTTKLQQDDILTLQLDNESVVPLQQTYTNKVEMKTNEYPDKAGIYTIKNKENALQNLSYNYRRDESNLTYGNISDIEGINYNSSISSAIEEIKSATNVNELWKWFIIFALIFLLIEMLILKFFK